MAERKLPRFLTPAEIEEMLRISYGNRRDSILMKCMYFLGMRNSEVQNIMVDDIDLINGLAKIVQGKGKKDRYVPIPKGLAEELKEYIGPRREGLLIRGRNKGGKISDRHLRRIVKAYAKEANVRKYEEIHPHTLRHSYATHLQNSGVPLNIIQNLLGHERIETTTIYTHMGVEKAREWVEKAFNGFWPSFSVKTDT